MLIIISWSQQNKISAYWKSIITISVIFYKLGPDVTYTMSYAHHLTQVVGVVKSRGDSAYERGGDACKKFWIKPLKETDLGVAQAFFDP